MKTCPICHATAFDDMAVCYGCLHRFDQVGQKRPAEHDGLFTAVASSSSDVECFAVNGAAKSAAAADRLAGAPEQGGSGAPAPEGAMHAPSRTAGAASHGSAAPTTTVATDGNGTITITVTIPTAAFAAPPNAAKAAEAAAARREAMAASGPPSASSTP